MTTPEPVVTDKQEQIFRFMVSHHALYGSPATIRQIARAFGWEHPNSVAYHLKALVAKGRVRKSGPDKSGHYVAVFPGKSCSACGQQLSQASTK